MRAWRSIAGGLVLGIAASAAWAHGPVVEVEDSWFSSEADGTPRITRAEVGERVWWFVRARNRGDAAAPSITVRLVRDGRVVERMKFKDRDRLEAGSVRAKGKRLAGRELGEAGRRCYRVEVREPRRRHVHLAGSRVRELCLEVDAPPPPMAEEEEPGRAPADLVMREMFAITRRLLGQAMESVVPPRAAERIRPRPVVVGLPGEWRVLDAHPAFATQLRFGLANDSREPLRGTVMLRDEEGRWLNPPHDVSLAPGETQWVLYHDTAIPWDSCFQVTWQAFSERRPTPAQVLRNDRGQDTFCLARPAIRVQARLVRIYVYNNGDDDPVDMRMEYNLSWRARGHRHLRYTDDPVRFRRIVEDESAYRIDEPPSVNSVDPGGSLFLEASFIDEDQLSSDETGWYRVELPHDVLFDRLRNGFREMRISGTTVGDLRIDVTFVLTLEPLPSSVEVRAR